ncbi:MAG: DUF58 domain-containing protein [Polyangiales bacterium]
MTAFDPTRPVRGRARVVAGILFHTVLLLVMPFLVGGITGFFAEVSQVRDTLGGLVRFASALLLPVLVVQLAGVAVKVRRERAAARDGGDVSTDALLESVHRHVRVLTDKGLGMFFGALFGVMLSLVFKFAELGIIAVLGLVTLYLLVAAGVVLSTFVVTRFEQRLATRRGTIGREFSPVLVEAGDSVEERFHFERVPVPSGFNLRVHQALPARLATESRHVVGPAVSQQRVTLSLPLRRTPRGDYHIGPADVAYTDLFGLTRVSVAQSVGARLKVLPRLFPVGLGDTPRSVAPEEGVLNVLRKFPTDDHFRFRDYVAGDDSRRIHWKLSLKVGRLQVRLPETVPVTPRKVRLVLDNFLPAGVNPGEESDLVLGDALDHLVEVWLSLARALTERGENVTLVLATGDAEKPFEEIECRRGAQARWREVGARATWQTRTDFHQAAAAGDRGLFIVVVTARFSPLPPLPQPQGAWLTWVFLPMVEELPGPVPGVDRFGGHKPLDAFLQPFPPGAEENGIAASGRRSRARKQLEAARLAAVRRATSDSVQAEAEIRGRGEIFYRVRRSGPAYVLDGR